MNWTGGRLQRSRNANKGIQSRQKQYFARRRTELQSGSDLPGLPFRPNYLDQDEKFELGGRLPAYGTGSIRHAGHSKRLHRHGSSGESPEQPSLRHSQRVEAEQAATPRRKCYPRSNSSLDHTGRRQKRKRHETDDDIEEDSLESSRRRLLETRDWVGLAPSRPVELQFLPSREKSKIGKRRKTRELPPIAQDANKRQTQRPLQNYDGHLDPYMSRETRNGVQDIRVRIGTDALTNQTHPKPQTTDCEHSPTRGGSDGASSDPMLFDHEDLHIASRTSARATFSPSQYLGAFVGVSAPVYSDPPQKPLRGDTSADHHRLSIRPNKTDLDKHEYSRKPRPRMPTEAQGSAEKIGSCFQITEIVAGVERPLRFVFDQSSDPTDVGVRIPSQGGMIGDAPCGVDTANAAGYAFGRTKNGIGDKHEDADVDKVFAPPSIVDDGPWKTFLGIPEDSSSHDASTGNTKADLSNSPQKWAGKEDVEVPHAMGSQHATLGDQTCISLSSCVSDSLPSLREHGERNMPGNQFRVKEKLGGQLSRTRRRGVEEVDELWQRMVLGSNPSHSADESELDETSTSNHAEKDQSRLFPSSTDTGSLVSSVPFKT
ncbi:hypothetical protein BDV95DRAFT_612934 [Massariosphaeria phaeospora]|uniref:Uncharacterized protein n=1 Tax=Massariosphaeria phaeospora TaxID=100035 RepID=A0A7C8MB84_9PLEO|nr:hypothetical protein BDV95DRAFT_612934 [Massariosphaeria phaeospora]